MNGNTKRRSTTGDIGIVVRADWTTGPRTPAWDRLWKAIFAHLDPEPAVVAGQQFGREGDDG